MQQLDLFTTRQEPQKAEKQPAEKVAPQSPEKEIPAVAIEPINDETPVTTITASPEKKQEPTGSTANKRGRKSFKDIDAEVVTLEIPDDEILFQKQYYSISEVAKWFNVNQSLLRYWENEFVILKPRKTRKGDRLFRPEDVKNLQLIYHLLRQRKFSIEGARQYLKDNKRKVDAQMQLIQSLTKIRAFLLEWKANLGV